MNPFDVTRALEAHARLPAGTPYRLLSDDPEPPEVVLAEQQRQRVRAWRQARIAEARALGIPIEQYIASRRGRNG